MPIALRDSCAGPAARPIRSETRSSRHKSMTKQIRLNAFDMNSVGHIQHGMWTHPRDQSARYTEIEYWQHLARTAERGLFDAIFLADIIGVYDVYGGSPAASSATRSRSPSTTPCWLFPSWRR